MGGERTVEHQTTRTPDPPTTAAGAAAGTAAANAAQTTGAGAGAAAAGAAPAVDQHLQNWVATINRGDKSASLAQSVSYCSHIGSGITAMANLTTAGKRDAFFALIRNGRPHSALDNALMNQLYHRPIPLADKQTLFEARYNLTITGEAGASFTEAELDTLYDESNRLPVGHIEDSPAFRSLNRTPNSAAAEGSHGPSTINMRDQGTQARYAETFRHEVGHAVDDTSGGKVADLRLNQAGWKEYATVADFVGKVGYGSIPEASKDKVKAAVDAYVAAGGPWDSDGAFDAYLTKQITDADEYKTVSKLYGSNTLLDTMRGSEGRFYGSTAVAKWPVDGGNAYFVNFYYHKVFSVTAATHTDLAARGNAAACFSDKEWFAEMYQEWYRTATPGSGSFPQFVTDFFKKEIEPLVVSGRAPAQGGGGHPRVPRG